VQKVYSTNRSTRSKTDINAGGILT